MKFLNDVSKEWINDPVPQQADNAPSTSGISKRGDHPERLSKDPTKHKLVKIITGGIKVKPQKQCRVCAAHKKEV
ncbi:piggybac transposable element-derived protein 4-like protein [Vairimorpha apis BRL 01]|uniref:Piggybac transposable element-derived protein 4-like protein n=1 Tax=Vairimorpha apis BRL 01 TaxID=1037528 RepID=T0L9D6_9MICR|nr:piggybac transposable element-derived protein 4-like protein [Vairimorpha apis BRL 01]